MFLNAEIKHAELQKLFFTIDGTAGVITQCSNGFGKGSCLAMLVTCAHMSILARAMHAIPNLISCSYLDDQHNYAVAEG